MFPQDERLYMVQAIRFVTQALMTSGMDGWMPLRRSPGFGPDIYVVNEDGDKPEKQEVL